MRQRSYDGFHLFWSVHSNHLVVFHLLANVNIGVQTVQNACRGCRVEGHEKESDGVGQQKHDQQRTNWRVDLYVKLVEVDDQSVCNACVKNRNGKFAKYVENAANTSRKHESS